MCTKQWFNTPLATIGQNGHLWPSGHRAMGDQYFPSLLLMLITYATTFFKPFFFEAALSVNLTTMLVMTTIFISKMEGLPLTSDIKMIDIWLIFCQLVPFSEVVLLTAIEYLRELPPSGGTNNIKQVWERPEN